MSVHVEAGWEPVAAAFRRLTRRGQGGAALVVRHRGEVVVSLCAGHADAAGTRPWTEDTLGISFSTTKGISALLVHQAAERGQLAYDDPIAQHWPAFGAGGKQDLTVRHLLTHRTGLASVRAVADQAEDLLDFEQMEQRLAARAVDGPTQRSAYHAITWGWLVAGLLHGATGSRVRELMDGLQVDGLHLGAPAGARERVAEPVGGALRAVGAIADRTAGSWQQRRRVSAVLDALHVSGFHRLFEGPEPPIWTTEMPAVNGAFSAHALAELYGELAGGGGRFLQPATLHEAGRVQVRTADAVLGLPMRWRLGWHQAFAAGRPSGRAFGHFGYGGSGGWADPDLALGVGFVTNRIGSFSTPMGDLTLPRLNRVIRDCARG